MLLTAIFFPPGFVLVVGDRRAVNQTEDAIDTSKRVLLLFDHGVEVPNEWATISDIYADLEAPKLKLTRDALRASCIVQRLQRRMFRKQWPLRLAYFGRPFERVAVSMRHWGVCVGCECSQR
ncbi:hypothetical protein NXC24_PB00356 (plasmid) [Rhizobium sp. NXC24]|nr:hypothetical protein NXC24_PB00356 [Rhizobium sp. NXC24]